MTKDFKRAIHAVMGKIEPTRESTVDLNPYSLLSKTF
jgi:hypothetical protein